MLHQPWQSGSDTLKGEGTKLLGCVAPVIGTMLQLAAERLPVWNNSHYRYRVMVSPPPPGGVVIVAAEGIVQQGECLPNLEAQRRFLHILFSTDKHRSL